MENAMLIVGKNIRKLRKQSGFTQSSIAKYLNVNQSLMSKIEKGEQSITSDMLDRLAVLFGIPTENLLHEIISIKHISFPFRASKMNEKNLEAISAINRIVFNLRFMRKCQEFGKKATE